MKRLAGEWVQKLSVDNALSGIRRVNFTDVDTLVMGRPVHLLGLYVKATVPWTSTAATMTAAMPGELIPAVLQDFRLRIGAQEYFRGTMDGKDMTDCARQRIDRAQTPLSDIPDADDTGTSDVGIYIPISRPAAPSSMRYDYSLPIEALANCGQSEFTFTSGTAARGFAGVVFGATTALTVYAHLAPLDDIRESIWHWERFSSQTQQLEISGDRGGVEGLLWRTCTAAGSPDVTDATEILTTVGGTPIGRAISGTDLATAGVLPRFGLAPLSYSSTSFDGLDLISSPTRYQRTKLPRGRLYVTWATRNVAERFLGMFTGDRTKDAAGVREVRSALHVPNGAGKAATVVAYAKKPTQFDAVLDGKLYWGNMPGAIPRAKAAAMGLKSA